MPEPQIQLIIPGVPVQTTPDADVQRFLKIAPISSHSIQAPARGEAAAEDRVEAPDDAIVKLEYASGLCEWLRADQFRAELGVSRDAGPLRVPIALNRGAGATRGPADWVLKALHVFGVSPADALASETADLVVKHFDEKITAGLFRVKADGSFGDQIMHPPPASDQPYLVFIHGTASSTLGSFSGFWSDEQTKKPTAEWNQIVSTYGDRILALEHRTFSVSPAQNALDLAQLLPENATVHVVTHSRGGLVGELLGLPPLTPDDLLPFQGRPDAQLMNDLSTALAARHLNIAKFVRTACPAAGTIMASKRLDLYLNIILNVIGLIPALAASPAYALFKATALELIKLRADPTRIPGIEAQMPESPLIHLLNTRGRRSQSDLGVIAGDFEGSGVWGTLKTYALRAYYWEDNDFVVNTRSMSGGMEREKGVWQFLDQGNNVNHFSYFKNPRTRTHMLSWLASGPAQPNPDFKRVRGLAQGAGVRGAEQLPVAFIVPDVFGTHLKAPGDDVVWLNYDALARGRFTELGARSDIAPGDLHDAYQTLHDHLALSHDTVLFPYDWRKPIAESAAALADAVEKKLGGSARPIRFVAHGMGGLVVREFARNAGRWKQLCGDDNALLMLGTPNAGSWQVVRWLTGQSRLVRMLALLGRHSDSQIAATLLGFRGLLDILPEEMYDPTRWDAIQIGRPDAAALQASRDWRRQFAGGGNQPAHMFYVAGSAPATPSGLFDYTADGDGQVAYSTGLLKGVQTWYNSSAAHGDLIADPKPLAEILITNKTAAFDAEQRPRASITDSLRLLERETAVFFPGESDLVSAALGSSQEPPVEDEAVLRVTVAHGHLREAKYPLAVGHYVADSIVSAEAQLDRQLDGRLSNRFHMDVYPGAVGTTDVLRVADAHPPGALIIGLGEVGEITPGKVRQSMLEACLRHALMQAEDGSRKDGQPSSAAFSSLLIGASGGRAISISESVTAIVQGAIEANRVLRRRQLWDRVRIDEVQFIELYEDTAIAAAHAAATLQDRLKPDLEPGERVAFDERLRTLPGGLVRRPLDEYATGWWRRIQIAADPCQERRTPNAPSRALMFESLTDRARAEQTLGASQTALVDSLLAEAIQQPSYDENSAVALFELLIPNPLKDQAHDGPDLVLVLDDVAARFPWELMAERTRRRIFPLSVQMGMIRQLKTTAYRPGPRGAHGNNALVVGDTTSDLPPLPGAQAEAREVAAMLSKGGYDAEPALIQESPLNIIRKLFAQDYRILHLAGHGIYNPDEPARSGMVLSKKIFLTPFEICQIRNVPDLVFINCCHLGNIDQRLHVTDPHKMAASVAGKLIDIGVRAVVAAGWAVSDVAAVEFAKTFYRGMLAGDKFGESVKRARAAAHALGANNTWGAYQCYGNPDFVLTPPTGKVSWLRPTFYSRREYKEELKDIAAAATGAGGDGDVLAQLRTRVAAVAAAIPSAWRDGDLLCALADAHKCMNDFPAAVDVYREALLQTKATATIEAIEQMANALDRSAKPLFVPNRKQALEMWKEASDKLEGLNTVLGPSSERLSLLGALWKRRGQVDEPNRKEFFTKAADYYRQAYEHARNKNSTIDPYSGLNWLALSYVTNDITEMPQECLLEAKCKRDDPDFWKRIYLPDALLLENLIRGTLAANSGEVVKAYREALQHASPAQRDSALGQVNFIRGVLPSKDESLERIVEEVCR